MKLKYWQKLLIDWRKDGNDGFTIPFIVGSQKYLPSNHIIQDVEELIIDIAADDSYEVYIKPCMTTGDLVIGIKDVSKNNLLGKFINFQDDLESNLFLNKICEDLGDSVETVASELYDRYQHFVVNEEYSKNDKERGDYEPEEIKFIKDCYNDYFVSLTPNQDNSHG